MAWEEFIAWATERAEQVGRANIIKEWAETESLDFEFYHGAVNFVAPKVPRYILIPPKHMSRIQL